MLLKLPLTLLSLGFITLYFSGRKGTNLAIASLDRHGGIENWKKDRQDRLGKYAAAARQFVTLAEAKWRPAKRFKQAPSKAVKRVSELERLLAVSKRSGWTDDSVGDALRYMSSANKSEVDSWALLPAPLRIQTLEEMIMSCSSSPQRALAVEAVGLIAAQSPEQRRAIEAFGLNRILILLLGTNASESFKVTLTWALYHSTATWTQAEVEATESVRGEEATLMQGAAVSTLVDLAFAKRPLWGSEYRGIVSFLALDVLVLAATRHSKAILAQLRSDNAGPRLQELLESQDESWPMERQRAAAARLVAQLAYEGYDDVQNGDASEKEAAVDDVEWLSSFAIDGLYKMSTKPRRTRHCAASNGLKVFVMYPAPNTRARLHKLFDGAPTSGLDTRIGLDSAIDVATSSHTVDWVQKWIPAFARDDVVDVLFVLEAGFGTEIGAILHFYRAVPAMLHGMGAAMEAIESREDLHFYKVPAMLHFYQVASEANQTASDAAPGAPPETARSMLALLSDVFGFAGATPTDDTAVLLRLWARCALRIASMILVTKVAGRVLDFFLEIAALFVLDGALRSFIILAAALSSWHCIGVAAVLRGAAAWGMFVLAMLPLGGACGLLLCGLALPLVALPHTLLAGLFAREPFDEILQKCLGIAHAAIIICAAVLSASVAAPLFCAVGVLVLVCLRHACDAVLFLACDRGYVRDIVARTANLLFVVLLVGDSPLADPNARTVAYFHLREAFAPAVRALKSGVRWARRRPVPSLEPQAGDVCLVCHEVYGEEAQEDFATFPPPLAYCRWGCGKAVHKECMDLWRTKQDVCVLCGAGWS
mmetsp:Transcript_25158/g.86181  ORF Transcript_25158/g.86181 Transcript_25158/m.86181 type:complete len:823 (+) Transcript_25158:118-2586(+)